MELSDIVCPPHDERGHVCRTHQACAELVVGEEMTEAQDPSPEDEDTLPSLVTLLLLIPVRPDASMPARGLA